MDGMRAALGVGRRQLRRRWAATAVLVVLVGLAGGVVLAAVAGASRTGSAMGRFVAYSRPEDLIAVVNGAQGDPSDPSVGARATAIRSRFEALPEVASAGRAPYIFLAANPQGSDIGGVNAFAAADTHMFRSIERPRVLSGRLPDPRRADEAVVDDVTAAARHVHVGSRMRLWAFTAAQQGNPETTFLSKYPAPAGPEYSFHVVGVVRVPAGVDAPPASAVRDAAYGGVGSIELTPAFLRHYAADEQVPVEALPGMEIFRVRLRHGRADAPAFERAVAGIVSPGDGQVHLGSDATDAATKTSGAIHIESLALVLFATLAGLTGLLVLGQALNRQVATDALDHRALGALGMSHRELAMVPMVRASVVAVGGAALALIVAVALSPLMPIGLARRAEIHPGTSVDVLVLALGFVGKVALTLGWATVAASRAARRARADATPAPSRHGRVRAAVARLNFGPSAAAGLSMSTDRRPMAFRAALLAAFVAVAGVVGAVTFGVSLDHLVDTPREQGWNWDVFVGNPNAAQAFSGDPIAPAFQTEMTRSLAANRHVGAFTAVALTDGTIDRHTAGIAGVQPIKGSIHPRVILGHSPRTANQIAVGHDLLEQLHKRIGQTVTVQIEGHHAQMRIVGEALQPTAGDLSTQLAGGAVTTLAGLQRLQPGTAAFQFAVQYRPGANHDAARKSLLASFGREVLHPYPGGEVGNLARINDLPYLLAGLLVVLASGALGLTLLSSVRNHRRDLAVLEAIGFVRHQIIGAVSWQATALATVALVLGIPTGLALGRWSWRLVTDNIGSVSPTIVPLAAVLLVIPTTFLVANLLATGPAWRASRIQPSEALRKE
jgi:hypothetical protein